MAFGVILWVILIILGIIILWFIFTYNRFIVLRNRIENAFSQIDVQLKRRYDLIPNLIESVKGYMKHEKTVLTDITKARSSLISGDIHKKAQASNQITEALKTIFAVAEDYPKLQASQNFLQLQEELSGTESKIAYSRQFYNDSVLAFNQKVQGFPSNILANIFNFDEKEYFEVPETERKAVKVKF